MANYIDSSSVLHLDDGPELSLTCPHCLAYSSMSVAAAPAFADVAQYKLRHVGVVLRCHSCSSPVFLRYPVKALGDLRIELGPQYTEIERPTERFVFTYIPEHIGNLFREALGCYSHGLHDAFASMCRRTALATFDDLGESQKLRLFDQVNDIRDFVNMDASTFGLVARIISAADLELGAAFPIFNNYQAAVLLEVMKDFLYQAFVRRGRLQHAMKVRRFFVEESIAETARNRTLRMAGDGPAVNPT
ncbi:MAG: hypothetical protein R3E72_01895 [Steroidobacteraceae bacterium]|jgi:hypothetical protein|nr:hypothetical protein [Planctomycetales bacterium]